jgi:hypothetical protein
VGDEEPEAVAPVSDTPVFDELAVKYMIWPKEEGAQDG